jgi:CDGSH-type Zn-finger protein
MGKLGTTTGGEERVEALLVAARDLVATIGSDEQAPIAARLERSVVRPLDDLLGRGDGRSRPAPIGGGSLEQRLSSLAEQTTELRLEMQPSAALLEATAGLHDLVGKLLPERLPALSRRLRELQPAIVVAPNGPYLVTNAPLNDWQGASLPERPQLALCRCGESRLKPLCDGAHAENGFSDEKGPNRVPDRRDSYVGEELTVLDNRGLCAHAGFCTDRLETVFHVKSELFVTPNGARKEEIIRAILACPSGALSYAIDGVEARDQVDQARDPAIEVSKDGPYRVTGALPLLEPDGEPVARDQGASLEHYSLCRCGKSRNKPFCSGAHWYVGFHDPELPTDPEAAALEVAMEIPVMLPGPDEPLSFEVHVRPLFREGDRRAMRSDFDLWDHGDVSTHADAILRTLQAGTMPCDGAWPAEHVAVFARWVEDGKPA